MEILNNNPINYNKYTNNNTSNNVPQRGKSGGVILPQGSNLSIFFKIKTLTLVILPQPPLFMEKCISCDPSDVFLTAQKKLRVE